MADVRLPDISYSTLARSFQAIKNEMLDRIQYFTPEWTDRTLADFGIGLIHVFSWSLDAYHWVTEMILNEAFLATCKRRSSLVNHLRQYGTQPTSPAAATVQATITVESIESGFGVGVETLLIGWQVQALLPDDIIVYELQEDLDLPGAGETITATFREGRTLDANLAVGVSDGTPFQIFQIADTTSLHNSAQPTVRIYVGVVVWTVLDTLAFSQASDQHCVVRWTSDRNPEVVFGDGVTGAIPPNGSNLWSRYVQGGGERGNKVTNGTLTQIIGTVPLGFRLSITNATDAGGGTDWEVYESSRSRAATYWATQDRAVTPSDYESLCLAVPGVIACRAEPTSFSVVLLWVVPSGAGQQASTSLRQLVLASVSDRIGTDNAVVGVWDPGLADYRSVYYARVDISINLRIKNKYPSVSTQTAVTQAVADWMDPTEQEFGGNDNPYLYLSDFIGIVEDVEGVDSLDVTRFSRRIEAYWTKRTGDATIQDADFILNPPNETWWVEFTSPETYDVRGEIIGGQGSGILNSRFIADGGFFALRIISGATPMRSGDKFWFKTSRRVDNVPLDDREFPILGIFQIGNAVGGY